MITSKGTPTDFKERLVQWATTTNEFPWFGGSSKDLRRWLEIVESACEDNQVDKSNWAEAGIMFVSGDLKHVMDERRVKYLEKSPERTFWAWEDFKDDIARVVAEGERSMWCSTILPLESI
ncbi:hypothetical protein BKA70DRAFT_1300980 [Coprinopsis sp. MPI-PUGE-AT-0042]|nr:hypothetical protein BKA70DRAFT_1300980 [Coprinopsis sp. MPI-PUGE-AT-0042]